MVIEMKKRFVYAAGPTILTIFFVVQCIMRYEELSNSVIFCIWYILPTFLLGLSYITYFLKKWIYTVPLIVVAMIAIFTAADGDIVLGIILLVWVLLYSFSCMLHQRAKECS